MTSKLEMVKPSSEAYHRDAYALLALLSARASGSGKLNQSKRGAFFHERVNV
jgi:hypothetical protein